MVALEPDGGAIRPWAKVVSECLMGGCCQLDALTGQRFAATSVRPRPSTSACLGTVAAEFNSRDRVLLR